MGMEINVSEDARNIRIDVWLTERLGLSRSGVQRLILGGEVLVNSKPVKPNYKMRAGDAVFVTLPEPEPYGVEAEDIPLEVVYEDEYLIVVNKPRGMVVHPAPGHLKGTLVNALLYRCGGGLSGINGVVRPGIVHRIDRDTSGLIVAAKTDAAHISLSRQLVAHTMERSYLAIACGNIREDSITIDKPIARHKTERKKMAVLQDGRRAVTHIKVLERFAGYNLIEARLETGRTHQIRVHMASIGRPLLGDFAYGPEKQPFGIKGQALHAKTLGFLHPAAEKNMSFSVEPPRYFKELIDMLREKVLK